MRPDWYSLVLFLAAILGFLPKFTDKRPTDEQIDTVILEALAGAGDKARQKLDIDESQVQQGPLVSIVPALVPPAAVQLGKDGRRRFSTYKIAVILLTDKYLAIMTSRYDVRTDITSEISMQEATFPHVVDIELQETLQVFEGTDQLSYVHEGMALLPKQKLRIGFSSGGGFTFPMTVHGKARSTDPWELPGTPMDHVVGALRSIIRPGPSAHPETPTAPAPSS